MGNCNFVVGEEVIVDYFSPNGGLKTSFPSTITGANNSYYTTSDGRRFIAKTHESMHKKRTIGWFKLRKK